MLIRTNKKIQIFSKRKDVQENSISLLPEYLNKIDIFDENIELKTSEVDHKILIRFPVDKLAVIKNDIHTFEGYICQNASYLRSRQKTFDSFSPRSKTHLNYAVFHREILARESFRRRHIMSGRQKIFSVDISSGYLSNIKNKEIFEENKSLGDIFGTEEVFVVKDIKPIISKVDTNIQRADLNDLSVGLGQSATGRIGEFTAIENLRKQNNKDQVITKKLLKKRFNKLRKSGIDPAVMVSKTKYNSQTLEEMTRGILPEGFSSKGVLYKDFGSDFHKFNDHNIATPDVNVEIKREKRVKRHDAIESNITINTSMISKFGESFDIVIYAKNKKGRIVDYYIMTLNLKHMISEKARRTACLSLNDYSVMCQRDISNKSILKISNNTGHDGTFRIIKASYNPIDTPGDFLFERNGDYKVDKKQEKFIYTKSSGPFIGKSNSIFYRFKPMFDNVGTLDNTKFDSINTNIRLETTSFVSLSAKTDNKTEETGIRDVIVTIGNLPEDCLGINIVKRNLTKKEKKYNIIKNLQQSHTLGSQSLLDLKENFPVFLNSESTKSDISLSFVDNDVEEGDIYEYKALIYRDNCVQNYSTNSLLVPYEKRRNIVTIKQTKVSKPPKGKFIESGFRVYLQFSVTINEDVIDDLFNSLDRNSYDLFSQEFKKIKESIKKNISCQVELLEKKTGTKLNMGNHTVKNGKFSIKCPIDDSLGEYDIIVIPRIASTSYVIENILDKVKSLPSIQNHMPISPFFRNFYLQRSLERVESKGRNLVSKSNAGKYSGKSIRFFGLILDPITKYANEKEDFYFEGSTGDSYVNEIYKPQFHLARSNLTISGFSDLSFSERGKGKNIRYKKIGIVKFKSDRESFTDFHAIYSKSAGGVVFHGMISPEHNGRDYYNFFINLGESVGLVEIYATTVYKDGSISLPKNMIRLVCQSKNIRAI